MISLRLIKDLIEISTREGETVSFKFHFLHLNFKFPPPTDDSEKRSCRKENLIVLNGISRFLKTAIAMRAKNDCSKNIDDRMLKTESLQGVASVKVLGRAL